MNAPQAIAEVGGISTLAVVVQTGFDWNGLAAAAVATAGIYAWRLTSHLVTRWWAERQATKDLKARVQFLIDANRELERQGVARDEQISSLSERLAVAEGEREALDSAVRRQNEQLADGSV